MEVLRHNRLLHCSTQIWRLKLLRSHSSFGQQGQWSSMWWSEEPQCGWEKTLWGQDHQHHYSLWCCAHPSPLQLGIWHDFKDVPVPFWGHPVALKPSQSEGRCFNCRNTLFMCINCWLNTITLCLLSLGCYALSPLRELCLMHSIFPRTTLGVMKMYAIS